ALAALLLAGCGGAPMTSAPDAGAPPPFRGPVAFDFTAELQWADGVNLAQGPVAAANFSGNAGTVVYHGETLDAAVYRVIPFGQYTLAAIVATRGDNLIVLYAYCQAGGVNNWYYESL